MQEKFVSVCSYLLTYCKWTEISVDSVLVCTTRTGLEQAGPNHVVNNTMGGKVVHLTGVQVKLYSISLLAIRAFSLCCDLILPAFPLLWWQQGRRHWLTGVYLPFNQCQLGWALAPCNPAWVCMGESLSCDLQNLGPCGLHADWSHLQELWGVQHVCRGDNNR